MRIEKHTRSNAVTNVHQHFSKGERNAWQWAAMVFAVAALLVSLAACASTPPDVSALQEENARLQKALEECEADASTCLDLLIECETLHD